VKTSLVKIRPRRRVSLPPGAACSRIAIGQVLVMHEDHLVGFEYDVAHPTNAPGVVGDSE
jgi:hypothetical protein